jgi:hypothetical protein
LVYRYQLRASAPIDAGESVADNGKVDGYRYLEPWYTPHRQHIVFQDNFFAPVSSFTILQLGAPGVIGRKFTVHPSALDFTDLSPSGDQKGYPKAAPFRPAKSRLLAHV